MDYKAIVGLAVFVVMMIMIFAGVPVFVSMMTCAMIGFLILQKGDPTLMLSKFKTAPFDLAANYNYAVLPMFMLVGSLAGETGIANGAFTSMRAWLGRVKGGLLYVVVASNAVFGACSGSSIAGNIVFGKLSMPELEAAGYSRKYSLGCIAASGALSTLIPPSMAIIMYCLISPITMNVGTALMAGVIPGLITAIALCFTVRIIGVIKPGTIPPGGGEKVPMVEKLKTLKLLVPIIFLFGLIIGGTFAGWFTATVGGAIGAMAVCIYALVKRMPLKDIAHCIWEAGTMEAGIFPIIIGGQLFGSFIAATGLASSLANMIASVNAPRFIIFMLVVVLYVFCGCVMDIVSIIIITVPVVFPVLNAVGYSPYVLVICLCFMCEIAGLTPPIGMNVFATANALRVNPSEIFSGVIPYFICEFLIVLFMALVPDICLILPRALGAAGI
ncbi:MAG: TRAP transporter large permease subunit [Eubacterium sp.]|nr:TRAP transporter large permease subunit [Eubacterium sp.]